MRSKSLLSYFLVTFQSLQGKDWNHEMPCMKLHHFGWGSGEKETRYKRLLTSSWFLKKLAVPILRFGTQYQFGQQKNRLRWLRKWQVPHEAQIAQYRYFFVRELHPSSSTHSCSTISWVQKKVRNSEQVPGLTRVNISCGSGKRDTFLHAQYLSTI